MVIQALRPNLHIKKQGLYVCGSRPTMVGLATALCLLAFTTSLPKGLWAAYL